MGKYRPKGGDGAAGWGDSRSRLHLPPRRGGRQLFPTHGGAPPEGRGWGRRWGDSRSRLHLPARRGGRRRSRRVGGLAQPITVRKASNSSPFMGRWPEGPEGPHKSALTLKASPPDYPLELPAAGV